MAPARSPKSAAKTDGAIRSKPEGPGSVLDISVTVFSLGSLDLASEHHDIRSEAPTPIKRPHRLATLRLDLEQFKGAVREREHRSIEIPWGRR